MQLIQQKKPLENEGLTSTVDPKNPSKTKIYESKTKS